VRIPERIGAAELERTMKLQDVILKAMAKTITWMEAAEIAGANEPDDADGSGSGTRNLDKRPVAR
jgi:hypothetical protein